MTRELLFATTLVLVLGCRVETVVELVEGELDGCVRCEPTGEYVDSFPEFIEHPVQIDTVVATLHEVGPEEDCTSCVELGRCTVRDRQCLCLDEGRPLSDLGVLLEEIQFDVDLSRNAEYCVSVATLATGGSVSCAACDPGSWSPLTVMGMSCTYNRLSTTPGDATVNLNETICHNQISRVETPPPHTGVSLCVYSPFYIETIHRCIGLDTEFPCGPTQTCRTTSEYCVASRTGHSCMALPDTCGPTPSCACIGVDGICTEGPRGITVEQL